MRMIASMPQISMASTMPQLCNMRDSSGEFQLLLYAS